MLKDVTLESAIHDARNWIRRTGRSVLVIPDPDVRDYKLCAADTAELTDIAAAIGEVRVNLQYHPFAA